MYELVNINVCTGWLMNTKQSHQEAPIEVTIFDKRWDLQVFYLRETSL